jgi:hypothetical protein
MALYGITDVSVQLDRDLCVCVINYINYGFVKIGNRVFLENCNKKFLFGNEFFRRNERGQLTM